MRRNFVIGLVALGLAACEDGQRSRDPVCYCDGSPLGPDAGAARCNPVTQAGCNPGEKCTQVTYQVAPFLAKTECVADGTVAAGGSCTVGAAGQATGFDDCVAGTYCQGGACTEICTTNPMDSCSVAGNACVQLADLFSDLGADAAVGLCEPTCDPVAQDCTDAAQGCYVQLAAGEGVCARVPVEAMALIQDEGCYGPSGMAGACYLNGCDRGYQSLEPEARSSTAGTLCAAFCRPVTSYKGHAGSDPVGAAPYDCGLARLGTAAIAGEHQCRFVQTFSAGADQVPATVGFCVATSVWASCNDFDPDTMVLTYNTAWAAAAATMKDKAGSDALDAFCQLDATTMQYDNVACQGYGCLSAADHDAWRARFMVEGP